MSHNFSAPTLPSGTYRPINRCNLPAVILGGLTFQQVPMALEIDGVRAMHRRLFALLDALPDAQARAAAFVRALTAHFCLNDPEQAGASGGARTRANWRRLLRGWAFDSNNRDAAVFKGWVESRFGLLPRFHRVPLRDFGAAWERYERDYAAGLVGTNALEAQLDLVFTYCQYEFARAGRSEERLLLYRGVNAWEEHEILAREKGSAVVLFNNVVSFSDARAQAGTFGDVVLAVEVPCAKVIFHDGLIPGVLSGEGEYLAVGGVYRVQVLSDAGD